MPNKPIILLTMALNLVIGNLLLLGFHGKYWEPDETLTFHVVTSLVAIMLLFLVFRVCSRGLAVYKIILVGTVSAFLVPVLSIYIQFVIYGLLDGHYDAVIKSIVFAFIVGISSWVLWVPFAVLNSCCLVVYSRNGKAPTNT